MHFDRKKQIILKIDRRRTERCVDPCPKNGEFFCPVGEIRRHKWRQQTKKHIHTEDHEILTLHDRLSHVNHDRQLCQHETRLFSYKSARA